MSEPVESSPSFAAIVPAGGAGTRLWPLSRASRPKFLLDLTDSGRTLLQATHDRLAPLADAGVVVVTGAAHAEAVAAQLQELPVENLLAEPSPRDSMAAIGLAAAVLVRRDPEIVVGSFAADHVIRDVEAFAATVRQAVATAAHGHVVTIGITPTHPSTGFGYIRPGDSLNLAEAPDALAMVAFVEKPDAATATAYLDEGYVWNAGMFVAKAQVLLDHLRTQQPTLHAGLEEIADAIHTQGVEGARDVLERVWPSLTKIAIDHAIAEPVAAAGGMAVVPGSFGWDDVGDWHSLTGLLPGSDADLRILGDGHVLSKDATGLVVPAGDRTIAVVGIENVVVVDTGDALLVTTRAHAQDVKAMVDRLKAQERTDLT